MVRNFQVVDLVDASTRKYLGQALFCQDKVDCPYFAIDNRMATGELFEAFCAGAREVGAEVNLYHINMPILINSANTPYNEIRNTVVEEMTIRTNRNEDYSAAGVKNE